jgi:hypothetical protein
MVYVVLIGVDHEISLIDLRRCMAARYLPQPPGSGITLAPAGTTECWKPASVCLTPAEGLLSRTPAFPTSGDRIATGGASFASPAAATSHIPAGRLMTACRCRRIDRLPGPTATEPTAA